MYGSAAGAGPGCRRLRRVFRCRRTGPGDEWTGRRRPGAAHVSGRGLRTCRVSAALGRRLPARSHGVPRSLSVYSHRYHGVFPQVPWPLVLAVALSEIVFVPMVTQAAFAYAAHGRMSRAAAVPVCCHWRAWQPCAGARLGAPRQALIAYAWLHLVTTAVVVVAIWKSAATTWSSRRATPASPGTMSVLGSGIHWCGPAGEHWAHSTRRWPCDWVGQRLQATTPLSRLCHARCTSGGCADHGVMPPLFRATVPARQRIHVFSHGCRSRRPRTASSPDAPCGGARAGFRCCWGRSSILPFPRCGSSPCTCRSTACARWVGTSCSDSIGSAGGSERDHCNGAHGSAHGLVGS